MGADTSVEGINAHGNALGAETFHSSGNKVGVGYGGRADYHAPYAQLIHFLKVCHGAQTAAQLDAQAGVFAKAADYLRILAFTGFGAVKVNHVHHFRACRLEHGSHSQRIIRYLMNGIKIAFIEPHAAAVFQIYSRKNIHQSDSSQKFFSIFKPVSPLFSGWN